MSFASLTFLLFLPVVFGLHWLVPRKGWQNGVVLVASYFFYGWWDWRFCSLMLVSSAVDFAAGLAIHQAQSSRRRKAFLAFSLGVNLVILGFFKYYGFFADSLVLAAAAVGLELNLNTLTVVLPVGISFYTFQSLSYTLDVYQGRLAPTRNPVECLSFIAFFPQLVAGPIERGADLLPQFQSRRVFDAAQAREGCRFILWGLAKKLLLADNLAPLVDQAFNAPAAASAAALALGTVGFAFQIYCDFSGYSDVAVGVGRLFGIRLRRNFAYPYFARSVSEFWRRWHLSLSTWFRDYLYIPLGGSRGSTGRTVRNLLFTALLSGLWHGAAWHFVAWGALHGAYLGVERILGVGRRTGRTDDVPGGDQAIPTLPAMAQMALTFALVCAAWITFRAASLEDAWLIYRRLGAGWLDPGFYRDLFALGRHHGWVLGLPVGLVIAEWCARREWNTFAVRGLPVGVRWSLYTALLWGVVCFGTSRAVPFIYFRF